MFSSKATSSSRVAAPALQPTSQPRAGVSKSLPALLNVEPRSAVASGHVTRTDVTPIHASVRRADTALLTATKLDREVLAHNKNVIARNTPPLLKAAIENDTLTFVNLLSKADPNAPDGAGMRPIDWAVKHRNLGMVRALAADSRTIDVEDTDRTPAYKRLGAPPPDDEQQAIAHREFFRLTSEIGGRQVAPLKDFTVGPLTHNGSNRDLRDHSLQGDFQAVVLNSAFFPALGVLSGSDLDNSPWKPSCSIVGTSKFGTFNRMRRVGEFLHADINATEHRELSFGFYADHLPDGDSVCHLELLNLARFRKLLEQRPHEAIFHGAMPSSGDISAAVERFSDPRQFGILDADSPEFEGWRFGLPKNDKWQEGLSGEHEDRKTARKEFGNMLNKKAGSFYLSLNPMPYIIPDSEEKKELSIVNDSALAAFNIVEHHVDGFAKAKSHNPDIDPISYLYNTAVDILRNSPPYQPDANSGTESPTLI